MARIVPKLNLNKTPQLVDNNSLVFAKNIRLLKDGTIGPDTSLEEVETNTGDVTHHSLTHEAVYENVTNFNYSILDFKTAIAWTKTKTITLDENGVPIEEECFNFGYDDPTIDFDDKYKTSDKRRYIQVPSDEAHTIACYKYKNPFDINTYRNYWTIGKFKYDVNNNFLIETSGLILFIAVRKEYYNTGSALAADAPTAFYVILPKQFLGATIIAFNLDYIIINPVYKTKTTTQVEVQSQYTETWDTYDTVQYIAQIVGLDNKIYFFKESNYIKYSAAARTVIEDEYEDETFVTNPITGRTATFNVDNKGYVTRNGVLFQDSSIAEIISNYNSNARVKIFEYNEINNSFQIIECAWTYNGGKITGCVSVNSTGEYILTICEHDVEGNTLVPIKHINLTKCSENDDESLYTQAPNIPISNLKLIGRYIKNIPSGVYQFFIRYKIHDNFYTTWFPCSKELFAGTRKQTDTLQGSIKHTDLHEDSNNSFVFTIEHLFPEYCSSFEQYQLGFIVSSDGGVFARSWKHFDINNASTESIYFEYNKDDVEELDIEELLKVNYDLFNVENITQYKNRLYIANYKETDFNEDLASYAKNINVKLKLAEVSVSDGYFFNNIPLHQSTISGIYDSFGGTNIRDTFDNFMYCNNNIIEENQVSESSVNVTQSVYNNTRSDIINISKVFISYNNDVYYIYGSASENVSIEVQSTNTNSICDFVVNAIRNNILGIDANGNYKYRIDSSTIITIDNIHIVYKTFEKYTKRYLEEGDGPGSHPHYVTDFYIKTCINNVIKTIELKSSIFTSSYQYNEHNTLLPFTKYDFYVHFVKQNGIVTNGYFIGTKEITRYCKGYEVVTEGYPTRPDAMTVLENIRNLDDLCFYREANDEYAYYDNELTNERTYYKLIEETTGQSIIYPSFTNIRCPQGYVGCFISIAKYGNNVTQGFNYEYDSVNHIHKIDCLELDTLLYNIQSNIKVRASNGVDVTEEAVYCSSGTTKPVKHLGCSGHVEFVKNGQITTKCWIILDSVNKPYNKTLIKLTPYIKLNTESVTYYSNYIDINSPGYYCEVVKLNRQFCDAEYVDENDNKTGYYVSGTDIYTRNIMSDEINLEDVEGKVHYHNSNVNFIFSNFNLNYVSLTNDLVPQVRRYDIQREGSAEEGLITSSSKQFITTVNSLTASFILELKSMYRDYTRKLFYEYTENKITEFNNTIRVSSLDVDEIYRYIYRFEATDYYNVPTQRGIITNLVAVANTLYVHCEHSLFKFSDNKQLNANDEEVTLQENDIFNSGISEVFDAQYGYAGLQNREQSLVTYNAYVFYDTVAKIIYAFGGEQQIGNISEPIQKIIDWINPQEVIFVADELNDRFFVNLRNDNGNICLSFNFKAKSFIAIHDIDFYKGFHSRRHTYFVHNNIFDEDVIGWSIYRIIDKLTVNNVDNYIAYQNCYTPSLISISDMNEPTGINSALACIDVITNVEYEKIKVLNFINWICSEIEEYGGSLNYTAEEQLNRLYPGDKLRIYTDSTSTDLFELTDANGEAKLSNEQRNINVNGDIQPVKESWQYPQYNCGVFSMNYFRDIIKNGNVYTANNPDLFKYKTSQNGMTGGVSANRLVNLNERSQRLNLTQENALIYGKYFVMRLIFNNRNFKVENVIFNMNNYGKTK